MKTEEEIFDWLKNYLRVNLNNDWSGQNASLAELGLDSISIMQLIVSLEQWLEISISMEQVSQLSDIKELINILVNQYNTEHNALESKECNFKTYINPYLAIKLEQLKIDRTFKRAQGIYLFDEDGRRYIDFMAQYGALPFGHHPQEIWDAITNLKSDGEPIFIQPSLLDSAGQLAKLLISLAPEGLRYVTFSNSGTEAVEAALKMARHVTGRKGILSTLQGFHGKTFGALSATGKLDYQTHFGLPLPEFEHIGYGDVDALAQHLAAKPDFFAAFVVEPIQGEGGMCVAPPGYLRKVKEICQTNGVLLVIDEVQTGLGRTGALFACQEEGVNPDIMTLAKALGGGVVPIGATLCTEAAYSEKFALKHSSTFAGNALAARAGLATLDLLTKDGCALIKHVQQEGAYLKEQLQRLQKKHPWLIKEIRGRGFMIGIRFTSDRKQWQENFLGIAAQEKELAQFVASYLLNVEGVRLAPTLNGGDVLRVQPPLNATREQCDLVVNAIERTIEVLATRHTGNFYKGILYKSTQTHHEDISNIQELTQVNNDLPDHENHRFAFLLHPLDEKSYADYDPTLHQLTQEELCEFAVSMDGLIDPVVGSTAYIQSINGVSAVGDFIMISHTAEQFRKMPVSDALIVLRKGIMLAKERGASIVGLGAFTSIVSAGGALLTDTDIAITSGNSYTVVSGIEALNNAIQRSGMDWKQISTCILGATGAIGSCMAALLAERVSRLILVGNGSHSPDTARQKLLNVARMVVGHIMKKGPNITENANSLASYIQFKSQMLDISDDKLIQSLESAGKLILTTNLRTIGMADVIVAATSHPGKLIDDDMLKPGAIVCDISRPRSIHESILHTRPDVLVIDGGIISLPGTPRIGPYGIQLGTSYACMAETMLLALDGHFQHTSLGGQLEMAEIQRQQQLAKKHGFSLAGLQSFGKPLSEEVWQQFYNARKTSTAG